MLERVHGFREVQEVVRVGGREEGRFDVILHNELREEVRVQDLVFRRDDDGLAVVETGSVVVHGDVKCERGKGHGHGNVLEMLRDGAVKGVRGHVVHERMMLDHDALGLAGRA